MNPSSEKSDYFVYEGVTLPPDSMRFFITSGKYYLSRLGRELEIIKTDDLFSELFDDAEIESLGLSKEIERITDIVEVLQKKLDEQIKPWGYELNIAHGEVRILKALGLQYINQLRQRRNSVPQISGAYSILGLQALDAKMSRMNEIISIGVFQNASPWPLLIGDLEDAIHVVEDSQAEVEQLGDIPLPRIFSSIEIIDQQLRERCLDLLQTFDAEDQQHRFDTIINEATRVLEVRIRQLSGADDSQHGTKLMTFAFGGENPKLVVSDVTAEQDATHLMFRGFIGSIRNPFHHRLIEDMSRERVLQILGLVDYLIFLAQTATQIRKQGT